MGDRSSFINSYHDLTKANNLSTVVIPDNLLFKLSTPYTMSKILTKHLEEFHKKLLIDTNDPNPPSIIQDKQKVRVSKT